MSLYIVDDPLTLNDPTRMMDFDIQVQKVANVTKVDSPDVIVDRMKLHNWGQPYVPTDLNNE